MSTASSSCALACRGLTVVHVGSGAAIVADVDLQLIRGRVSGLVGESGSGKTTLGLALLGYARRGARITAGQVEIDGHAVAPTDHRAWRSVRGATVAYMPQDPATALNPALRLHRQLHETLVRHRPDLDRTARVERVRRVLTDVGLPDDDRFLVRYPFQLSGGQQQRVALAGALVAEPSVLVLDEPATGLDVTTQRRVLELIERLTAETGVASLYISHDLGAIADVADDVVVMYAGRIAERGPAAQVITRPDHPYTGRLLLATPRLDARATLVGIPGRAPSLAERPAGCPFAPRCDHAEGACQVSVPQLVPVGSDHGSACRIPRRQRHAAAADGEPVLHSGLPSTTGHGASASAIAPALVLDAIGASYGPVPVLFDVGLHVGASRCVALVGESGSGKSTLARSIVGLHPLTSGTISLLGRPLASDAADRTPDERRGLQYVFQNPYGALNPRRSVEELVRQPLDVFRIGSTSARRDAVVAALDDVALGSRYLTRVPAQLSGGERQRVAIARALVSEPDVLVCDEVTSALDVSVQASVVGLLQHLQRTRDFSMLFITHNLPLVRNLADEIVVLRNGRIVEHGPADSVLGHPTDDYTRALLADTPSLDRSVGID